ncbi:hypothetical protein N8T08_007441 [Aspergillus melleus]|uniref:Uncharacterized protein n=1 Tax=Aspergillus melleus TaxID=138277 RepID=A0ACC3AXF2_9EURO|nr:hypothetical protein N8T08_007441 [Aspergillus melleus]
MVETGFPVIMGFIHPPRRPPLTPEESQIAQNLFQTLIDHAPERTSKGGYKQAVLISETFDRIQFRASSAKTPQRTPLSLSSNQHAPTGNKGRASKLRQECLKRDRHRCVVSRKFDRAEAKKRLEQNENSNDDAGELLRNQRSDQFEYLEVAHIISPIPSRRFRLKSQNWYADPVVEQSDSKKAALYILDMFGPDIGPLIAGPEIDSPYNALTLTLNHHRLFGEFEIYFEQKDPSLGRTYTIDPTERRPFLRDSLFPVTRTLDLSPELMIDPPASKLPTVHCAIAHILKLSGAGEYIEKTLREITEVCVSADGSTDLGRPVRSRLGNYLNALAGF